MESNLAEFDIESLFSPTETKRLRNHLKNADMVYLDFGNLTDRALFEEKAESRSSMLFGRSAPVRAASLVRKIARECFYGTIRTRPSLEWHYTASASETKSVVYVYSTEFDEIRESRADSED